MASEPVTREPAGHEDRERAEVWREGITMALYVSLSQLAVMAAIPQTQVTEASSLALTVALTSVGLVLAHQVAFRMSSRLVAPGSKLEPLAPRLMRAQLVGGGTVTVIAVLPILLIGASAYRWSMALLLVFVMTIGYQVARTVPSSRLRSLLYVVFIGLVVVGVLAIKSLVNH